MSGAGFAGQVLPGVNGTNYIFPIETHFRDWSAKGIKLIRFPILWERLQPTLGGALDPTYTSLIDRTFSYANKYGVKIILDLHNYARYRNQIIGTSGVPYSAYQEIMARIAQRWSTQSSLYGYDIMNEPHDALAYWPTAAQYGINGVRSFDNVRPIFIEGNGWAEATRWALWNDPLLKLSDPANNIIFEAHAYFDANAGGTYETVDVSQLSPTYGVERVRPFVEWLKKNNRRGFIGEFGVPDNDGRWFTIMDNMLAYLKQNCIPATYWAAGPGWGSYFMSVEPVNGQDRPQWPTLRKYIDNTSCSNFGPASPNPSTGTSGSVSPSTVPQPIYPTDAQKAAVQQLYISYFGRAGDLEGLTYWSSALAKGIVSPRDIALAFAQTSAFQDQYAGLSYGDFVDSIYVNVLGRAVDAPGKAYWINALATGAISRAELIYSLINSLGGSDKQSFSEKTSRAFCLTNIESSKTKATQAQLLAVQQLYISYLGRAADLDGLLFWSNALYNGSVTVKNIAIAFAQTSVYQSQYAGLNYNELVDKSYLNLLGRAADSQGKSYWVGLLTKGSITSETFIYTLVNSLGGYDKINFNEKMAKGFCAAK